MNLHKKFDSTQIIYTASLGNLSRGQLSINASGREDFHLGANPLDIILSFKQTISQDKMQELLIKYFGHAIDRFDFIANRNVGAIILKDQYKFQTHALIKQIQSNTELSPFIIYLEHNHYGTYPGEPVLLFKESY